jgi:hypothetical protein
MFIEPRIEVNPIKDQATTQADARNVQLREQRDADPQVQRRLFLRQTPNSRQRQVRRVHQ